MTYRELLIERTDGREQGVLIYDEDDASLIESHSWHLELDVYTKYATTTRMEDGRKRYLRAGQLLLGWGPWGRGRVEHLNGNGLDCRRANLRHANQSEILAKRRPAGGSSPYKGVTWDRQRQLWLAQFRGRKLGRFQDEIDAARAFDEAAYAHWGRQAYLNFPELLIK